MVKLFVATKAFISYNGKILILRESSKYDDGSNVGKFDVPGGRITPGENFEESLLREIKEETNLDVKIGKPFFASEWRPTVKGEEWQIVGTFFKCEANSDKVKLGEDHNEFEWIDPNDYSKYDIIPNLKKAFEAYLE